MQDLLERFGKPFGTPSLASKAGGCPANSNPAEVREV
jgi:hypothetical protein